MPELFTNKLLLQLPAKFRESFDVKHAGRRLPPYMFKAGFTNDHIAIGEFLRVVWNSQPAFEDTARVLTESRLRAVCDQLEVPNTVAEMYWAIIAYGEECVTSTKRVQQELMRLSFERFFSSDRFEMYVKLGKKLAARRSAQSRNSDSDRKRRERDASERQRLDADRQAEISLIDQLIHDGRLEQYRRVAIERNPRHANAWLKSDPRSNPVLRAFICDLVAKERRYERSQS